MAPRLPAVSRIPGAATRVLPLLPQHFSIVATSQGQLEERVRETNGMLDARARELEERIEQLDERAAALSLSETQLATSQRAARDELHAKELSLAKREGAVASDRQALDRDLRSLQLREAALATEREALHQRELAASAAMSAREAALRDEIKQREAQLHADREELRHDREALRQARSESVTLHSTASSERLSMQQLLQPLQQLSQLVTPLQQLAHHPPPPPPQVMLINGGDHGAIAGLGSSHGGNGVGTHANPDAALAAAVRSPDKKPDDPLDAANVPNLVETFLREGGVLPLDVLVAEVEAMQQAATRLRVNADKCDRQLVQLVARVRRIYEKQEDKAQLAKGPAAEKAEKERPIDLLNASDAETEKFITHDLDREFIDGTQKQELIKSMNDLRESRDAANTYADQLQIKFAMARDDGVARFLPKLLTTVEKYEAVFEKLLMEEGAEAALNEIETMCSNYKGIIVPGTTKQVATFDDKKTKGKSLRQPNPSALPAQHQGTMMNLLHRAMTAEGPLVDVVQTVADLVGPGCRVKKANNPTKGVRRLLAKVHEEYEGDYTRVLDLSRCTLLCETVTAVKHVLDLLLWQRSGAYENDRSRLGRIQLFQACRVKDRLTRAWDAELSGGNRDLLINGWLTLGGGRFFIVEVQVHLEPLFQLKHDLHVLYEGARVLGAMDDKTIKWEGALDGSTTLAALKRQLHSTELLLRELEKKHTAEKEKREKEMSDDGEHVEEGDIIQQASRGVLRKLGVSHSRMTRWQRDRLHQLMHTEPCPLITLDLSNCFLVGEAGRSSTPSDDGTGRYERAVSANEPDPCFKDLSLAWFLSPPNKLGTISEVVGDEFAPSKSVTRTIACWRLRHLYLSGCGLSGELPLTLQECNHLEDLRLQNNALTGEVPSWLLDVTVFSKLQQLNLAFNQFVGEVAPTFSSCALKLLNVRNNKLSGVLPKLPPSLERIILMKNELSGLGDGAFDNCKELLQIELSGNRIEAPFPSLAHCSSLESIFLNNNQLHGALPEDFFTPFAQSLIFVEIQNNQLEGPIPSSIVTCGDAFKTFNLKGNRLNGPIPPLPPSLKKLQLSANRLSAMPDELPAGIEKVQLAGNELRGSCAAFSKLKLSEGETKLKEVDVSNNKGLADLPVELKQLNGCKSGKDTISIRGPLEGT